MSTKSPTNKKDQATKALIADLNSNDDKLVMKAIKAVRSKGNELIIPHLIQAGLSTTNEKIKSEVIAILFDLKSDQALVPMIEALNNPAFKAFRETLIASFWNSRLDASNYMDVFVKLAIEGDYMECLECLTVIENLEGPFEEGPVMESLIMLKEYFAQEVKDEKEELLRSVLTTIKKLDDAL